MIAYIHGYGVGLAMPPFTSASDTLTMGFEIMKDRIVSGEVEVFDWAERVQSSLLKSLLTMQPLQLYIREKGKISQLVIQEQLFEWLEQKQPRVIITHSLGARLLLDTFANLGSIRSVKKIIFVAPDIPFDHNLSMVPESIAIQVIHCLWDQALPWSWVINRAKPAGLFGHVSPRVINHFVPYRKGWNFHAGILSQKDWLVRVGLE